MLEGSVTLEVKSRLKRMGERLQELLKTLADDEEITDTLDYIAGALHALMRAEDVGFVDRPAALHPTYRPFLAKYVLDIVSGRPPHKLWLAGFYFNSGIQRIAACYDRIPRLL